MHKLKDCSDQGEDGYFTLESGKNKVDDEIKVGGAPYDIASDTQNNTRAPESTPQTLESEDLVVDEILKQVHVKVVETRVDEGVVDDIDGKSRFFQGFSNFLDIGVGTDEQDNLQVDDVEQITLSNLLLLFSSRESVDTCNKVIDWNVSLAEEIVHIFI